MRIRRKNGRGHGELTPRMLEVLQLAANGLDSIRTARALDTKADTVRRQRSEAYVRMGAENAAHAVAMAMRQGMIK